MNNEQVLELIAVSKWGQRMQNFKCRNCGGTECSVTKDFVAKCKNLKCRRKESPLIGTAFEGLRMKPAQMFGIISWLHQTLKDNKDVALEHRERIDQYFQDKKTEYGEHRRYTEPLFKKLKILERKYLATSTFIASRVGVEQKTANTFIKRIAKFIPEEFEGDQEIVDISGLYKENHDLYIRLLRFVDGFITPEGVIEALCKLQKGQP